MSAIQHLLERWGFVKLDRYGLVMTSERRIVSTRSAVLDDGAGGRVVGWQDRDLAATDLKPWQPAQAAPRDVTPVQRPIERRVITEATILAQLPPPASAAVMAVEVAPERVVDEDDWEWTIALAKARAAAPEPEVTSTPQRSAAARSLRPAELSAPSPVQRTRPRPMAAAGDQIDAQPSPSPSAAPAVVRAATPGAPAPATVIPVPPLPTILGGTRLAPVVRTTAPEVPSPRRLAKGTAPVGQTSLSEDTVPDLSIGDRTRPGIGLPEAARAVELPSIKRRMAARG